MDNPCVLCMNHYYKWHLAKSTSWSSATHSFFSLVLSWCLVFSFLFHLFLPVSPQSIIFFLIHSPKLSTWLKDDAIQEALQSYTKWHHIERDPQVFSVKIDEDYVHCLQGVTRASFCNVYLEWIQHCAGKMETVHHLRIILSNFSNEQHLFFLT